MSQRRKRQNLQRRETSTRKRLTTRQRWMWASLFAVGLGLLLSPYALHVIEYREWPKAAVLALIALLFAYLFGVALRNH